MTYIKGERGTVYRRADSIRRNKTTVECSFSITPLPRFARGSRRPGTAPPAERWRKQRRIWRWRRRLRRIAVSPTSPAPALATALAPAITPSPAPVFALSPTAATTATATPAVPAPAAPAAAVLAPTPASIRVGRRVQGGRVQRRADGTALAAAEGRAGCPGRNTEGILVLLPLVW